MRTIAAIILMAAIAEAQPLDCIKPDFKKAHPVECSPIDLNSQPVIWGPNVPEPEVDRSVAEPKVRRSKLAECRIDNAKLKRRNLSLKRKIGRARK